MENHNYRARRSTNLVRCSFSSLSNFLHKHLIFIFLTSLRGFIARKILDNHNYCTRHNIHLIWCSFFLLSNSLAQIFFYFLKEFYWKQIFSTIITAVPIIVYTRFGAHFLFCQILQMSILFIYIRDLLKGFYCKEIFWTIITTILVIVYI